MSVRWMRGVLLAITIGVGCTGAREAGATSIAPLSVEQLTDASTYIVEGTVKEVWTELDPERAMVWTKARISVTDVLKGPDSPTEIVVDSAGGQYGDFSVHVPAQAVFSADEQVVVFLDEANGRLMPVAKFLGKYTVRRAPGDREPYARTWHPSAHDVFDARFLPHPSVAERVYLADLEDRIQARLDSGWDGQPIPGLTPERLTLINSDAFRHPVRVDADRSTP